MEISALVFVVVCIKYLYLVLLKVNFTVKIIIG